MAIITPMTTPDVEVPDIHVRVGAAVHTFTWDGHAFVATLSLPDLSVPAALEPVDDGWKASVSTGALDAEGTAIEADASTALTAALADLARDIDEYCAEMRRDIDTLLEAVKS